METVSNSLSNWTIVISYYTEEGDGCQHCGHAIKEVFVITNGTATMNVGSDCVVNLVSPQDRSNSEMITKRMSRAAAQWRKNEPSRKIDETRTEYINRRVKEMGNAFRAYKVWLSLCNKPRNPKHWRFDDRFVTRYLRMNGVVKPSKDMGEYELSLRYTLLWQNLITVYNDKANGRIYSKIDKACGSNHYDYVNRSVGQIRKL